MTMHAPGPKRWESVCLSIWERDLLWWPFVFLRPAPQRRAGVGLVLGLSLAGTAVACAGALCVLFVLGVPFATARFAVGLAGCFAVVTALLGLSFALPWNRRARRLGGSQGG